MKLDFNPLGNPQHEPQGAVFEMPGGSCGGVQQHLKPEELGL